MLHDDYFRRPPPKSTGPEYFSPEWLTRRLPINRETPPEDIQATLTALTARSIAAAIAEHTPGCGQLICCCCGARNGELIRMLNEAVGKSG